MHSYAFNRLKWQILIGLIASVFILLSGFASVNTSLQKVPVQTELVSKSAVQRVQSNISLNQNEINTVVEFAIKAITTYFLCAIMVFNKTVVLRIKSAYWMFKKIKSTLAFINGQLLFPQRDTTQIGLQ